MTNKEVFIKEELEVIKEMYARLDRGELRNREIIMHGFLHINAFINFRQIFEKIYADVVEGTYNGRFVDMLDYVNFLSGRLYWMELLRRNSDLFNLYSNNIEASTIKRALECEFIDIHQVEEFKDKGWENYDIYDIRNKILSRSSEQVGEYLDKYKYLDERFPELRDYIVNNIVLKTL